MGKRSNIFDSQKNSLQPCKMYYEVMHAWNLDILQMLLPSSRVFTFCAGVHVVIYIITILSQYRLRRGHFALCLNFEPYKGLMI